MRYVVIAVLSVVALFGLLVLFIVILKITGKDHVHRTAEDVANTIEGYVEGRVGFGEWDDFVCVPIKDPELEFVRLRCSGLPDEFPAYGKYCNDDGLAVMRDLVARLRVPQAARPTLPATNEGHRPGATR